ncbi:putative adenylate kinase [Helianthus annuus]|nr:putative adenylate kinase [Helianthus annuus]
MAVLSRLLRARTTTSYTIRTFSSSYSTSPPLPHPKMTSLKPLPTAETCSGCFSAVLASEKVPTLAACPNCSVFLISPPVISFVTSLIQKVPYRSRWCARLLVRGLSEIVNQGKLVSDHLIINLLSKRLEAGDAKGESGFILDGFPRTIRQAEILEGVTNIDLVINLKLREEALLAKCLGRRTCSQCGGNYNVACIDIKADNEKPAMYMPPLLPPSHCASKLITRSDDTEEVVKERLRIYNEKSRPVEEFYRKRGKLLEFDLPGGIPESWTKLLQLLNLDDHEDKRSAAA